MGEAGLLIRGFERTVLVRTLRGGARAVAVFSSSGVGGRWLCGFGWCCCVFEWFIVSSGTVERGTMGMGLFKLAFVVVAFEAVVSVPVFGADVCSVFPPRGPCARSARFLNF